MYPSDCTKLWYGYKDDFREYVLKTHHFKQTHITCILWQLIHNKKIFCSQARLTPPPPSHFILFSRSKIDGVLLTASQWTHRLKNIWKLQTQSPPKKNVHRNNSFKGVGGEGGTDVLPMSWKQKGERYRGLSLSHLVSGKARREPDELMFSPPARLSALRVRGGHGVSVTTQRDWLRHALLKHFDCIVEEWTLLWV